MTRAYGIRSGVLIAVSPLGDELDRFRGWRAAFSPSSIGVYLNERGAPPGQVRRKRYTSVSKEVPMRTLLAERDSTLKKRVAGLHHHLLDAPTGHESDVFEAVEGGRRQSVALQQPDRLTLHLRELPHLEEERRVLGTVQELRFLSEAKPQLVGVRLPVLARRTAAVL